MKNKAKTLIAFIIMACMILASIAPVQTQASNANGSKKSPFSAYNARMIDIYGVKYYGKVEIKLLDYKDGKDAFKYLKENGVKKNPGNGKEYVYLKFKIKYVYGDETIPLDLVINDYWGIFDSKSKKQLNSEAFKAKDGTKELSYKTKLSPGKSVICSKTLLVDSGHTPITYRIDTGYDSNYNPIETWFTTNKSKSSPESSEYFEKKTGKLYSLLIQKPNEYYEDYLGTGKPMTHKVKIRKGEMDVYGEFEDSKGVKTGCANLKFRVSKNVKYVSTGGMAKDQIMTAREFQESLNSSKDSLLGFILTFKNGKVVKASISS